jgi:hypothetical protein
MHIAGRLTRKRVVLLALLAALAAAGVAYATIPDSSGVYTACELKATGTIRLIDPSLGSSSLLGHCTSLEAQITWNQRGQNGANGTNGISPTVAQLPTGDANCPAGGASLTDAAGHVAYVCNGKSFAGSFTSPNGRFSLSVADDGVTILGPGSSINLSPSGDVTIDAANAAETVAGDQTITVAGNRTESIGKDESLSVARDDTVTVGHDQTVHVANDRTQVVDSDDGLTVHGNRTERVDQNETIKVGGNRSQEIGLGESLKVGTTRTENVGATETINVGAGQSVTAGSTIGLTSGLVTINGGSCHPAARVGDTVSSTQILTGSTSVCIGG